MRCRTRFPASGERSFLCAKKTRPKRKRLSRRIANCRPSMTRPPIAPVKSIEGSESSAGSQLAATRGERQIPLPPQPAKAAGLAPAAWDDYFFKFPICLSGSWRIHDRAAGAVSGADFYQRRELDNAVGDAVWAARFEGASGRKLGDGRDGTFDCRKRQSAVGRESGDGVQQS